MELWPARARKKLWKENKVKGVLNYSTVQPKPVHGGIIILWGRKNHRRNPSLKDKKYTLNVYIFSKLFWSCAANQHHVALSWAGSHREKPFFKAVRSTLYKFGVLGLVF